ncbi:MAG: PilZ domain-containing protein [Pseudomonadota bacterium]
MTLVDKALFKSTPAFRSRRKRVLARVQLHDGAGTTQDVMVRDISAAGMSAVARTEAPAPNEIVTVRLPDGSRVWGVVRWVDGRAFGVELDPASRPEPAAPHLDVGQPPEDSS